MSMTLETIRAAHARIAPYIVPTPLLRLPALDDALGCEVYVKAECMQRTGAFKLRGAMNKILALTDAERASGFVAASSGNHGRAVAYAAQRFGTHACIVMPETAPAVKQAAIRALGAELVLCDASERFAVAARLCAERGATMVPPFNDELVMAGQGTVGLEIMAQCPEIDAVVVPVSGGGLIGGVSTAVKALAPHVRVFGAEPAALPRYTASLRAGHPVRVEQKRSIADALVAQTPGDVCFPYVAAHTDGFADVADDDILRGMKLLLRRASCCASRRPPSASVPRCAASSRCAGGTRSALSSAAAASRSSSCTSSRTLRSDREKISAPAHLPSERRAEADAVSGRYLLLASA